jgi:hypothetical protein
MIIPEPLTSKGILDGWLAHILDDEPLLLCSVAMVQLSSATAQLTTADTSFGL